MPIKLSETPLSIRRGPPRLGEHQDEGFAQAASAQAESNPNPEPEPEPEPAPAPVEEIAR
jgi:hypothetical protein